jgi:hypothetical protein
MATKPTSELGESPVPGVIPEPIHVQRDKARASNEAVPSPGRPSLARRLRAAIRGDKHMADAYPPPKER